MGSIRLDRLITLLKEDLKFLLSIALGIYLFLLFFQPIPFDQFDFNNRLLFAAGFVAIIFFFQVLIRGLLRSFLPQSRFSKDELLLFSYASIFLITILSSLAIAFYLRYVGAVTITFHLVFKVIFVCLVSPVLSTIYDAFSSLKKQLELEIQEKENIQKEIRHYQEDYQNQSLELISEHHADHLNVLVADLLLLRSADNYVEITYREGSKLKRKLIRNTLKAIEQQIKSFSGFVRCHRSSIVNVFHIEKLNHEGNSYWLKMKNMDEPVPVSRQYLLKIKEVISVMG
ncbi:LytR/AlgR family response regulator transcription factor [Sunxiuqinia sp. sy24]|uniref:LytR/AlgR family response regulator transcription factor n=1 Tax=Sunxiuqinia sp. sy24 TaxID=3461495 RepID=UPI0040457AA7